MSIEKVLAGQANWHVETIDCRAGMRTLPPKVVQTVVTSIPYWGLRDYGIPAVEWSDGSIDTYGLEKTPEKFIAHSVEVFAEVKRVLRDDGTLWLNIGDSYSGSGRGGYAGGSTGLQGGVETQDQSRRAKKTQSKRRDQEPIPRSDFAVPGYKPGDLMNMPHRVAEALQRDGWFWRSTIIWHKRSPIPESISGVRWVRCRVKAGDNSELLRRRYETQENQGGAPASNCQHIVPVTWAECPGCPKCADNGGYVLRRGKWRPTTGHEYIFLFSKSERYFCDGDAVQEAQSAGTHERFGKNPTPSPKRKFDDTGNYTRNNRSFDSAMVNMLRGGRNPRTVWTLSSEPYKGAHFATFPSELVHKCLKAATSKDCCGACGACYAPVVESERVPTRPGIDNKIWKHQEATNGDGKRSATSPNLDPERHVAVTRIIGYRSTCGCNAAKGTPLVLDCFNGAGTTGLVARRLGLRYIGTELNPEYAAMSRKRIRDDAPIFNS